MQIITDGTPLDDLLERKKFGSRIAQGLVAVARTEENGFVTALTGKWGCGKTVLMGYVKDELEKSLNQENIPFLIMDFNPWIYIDSENIRKSFLTQFRYLLIGSKRKWKDVISFAAKNMENLELVHSGLGKLGKEAGDLIKNYLDSDVPSKMKKEIDRLLLSADKKIFIFIDDIDRLIPLKVFEILQVIKLVASFKNTYYILAFDREAVELSIESQFKDYGKKYLDKIVQADFLIPEIPDEKIESVFFSGIDSLCSNFDIPYRSSSFASVWLHWGIRQYFATLRDIYRFLNSLQFSLPGIHSEIDITDFLVLEAIRLHDFDCYQQIYQDFNQSNYLGDSSIPFASDTYIEKVQNKITAKLLRFLFPKNILHGNKENLRPRLYDPKFFGRYFTLAIASLDIAESEFKNFMEQVDNRGQMLQAILTLGRFKNFLLRLNDPDLLKFYDNWDFSLISFLFSFANEYISRLEDDIHELSSTIVSLLSIQPKLRGNYFKQFLDLLLSPKGDIDFGRFYFLHYIMMIDKRDLEHSLNWEYEFIQFCKKNFDRLQARYLELIQNAENFYTQNPIQGRRSIFSSFFFYDYARYFPTEFDRRMTILLNLEENILFFLKELLLIGTNTIAFRIKSEIWNLFFPSKRQKKIFLEKLKNMDITILSDNEKQWREFALENLKIDSGDKALRLIEAAYFTSNASFNVLPRLQQLLENNELKVIANNDLMGDPGPGTVKTLRVKYFFGDAEYIKEFGEGHLVELP